MLNFVKSHPECLKILKGINSQEDVMKWIEVYNVESKNIDVAFIKSKIHKYINTTKEDQQISDLAKI